MAYTIGANDVANSWATSVGSGAIGLARATVIAGACPSLLGLWFGLALPWLEDSRGEPPSARVGEGPERRQAT